MTPRFATLIALSLAAAACGGDDPVTPPPTEVEDITLASLDPGLVVPGSTLVIKGSAFVPDIAGPSTLRVRGDIAGSAVELTLAAEFVDYDEIHVFWPGAASLGLPVAEGLLTGDATIEASNVLDGLLHRSRPLSVGLDVREALAPRLDALQNEVIFVNDPVVAHGGDFLLGGSEGRTFAIVSGCYTREGESGCTPVGPTEIGAEPFAPYDRSRAVFPFSPHIAGITPGAFTGSVALVNRHAPEAGHVELTSGSLDTANSIVEPVIGKFAPEIASLGQYVDVSGGGFVGPVEGDPPALAVTTVELTGTFTPSGGMPIPADLTLVTEFKSGQLTRYVLNEEDELGQAIDLRRVAGTFEGTARPVVEFESERVTGSDTPVTLGIGYVKQIVWLKFLPSYVESLRKFGLRAAETRVRDRVIEVVSRDYAGVNLELRLEKPTDFALYAEVELGGADPNGIGLLGYDNTPGKDVGNLRLYDKIGGVNALTQLDGYPGFGGVFVESLFSFSLHPGALADDTGNGDPLFDALFDPFRPDLGATPVGVTELGAAPVLTSSESCPAGDRPTQIGCAIWALGSLIGTTLSHEIAHSLGLADPGGEAFHNTGDWEGALMDAGGARPFDERAEIGAAPGAFCQRNYDYLREVLPTTLPDPLVRLDCQ